MVGGVLPWGTSPSARCDGPGGWQHDGVETLRSRRSAPHHRGGRLGVCVAALLLVVTVADALETPATPVALGLAFAVCLLAGAGGRRPVPAGVAVCALCTLLVVLFPGQVAPAGYASLAPVVACGIVGLTVARRWFTVWSGLLIFAPIAVRLPDERDPEVLVPLLVAHGLFVLVVVLIVWLAGEAVRVLVRQQRAQADSTLRALRRDIARDLHDGVAATLSVIALRAEQGRRQGGAGVQDLEFIADRSREAIEDLRAALSILRREPDCSRFRMDWPVRTLGEAIDHEVSMLRQAGFGVAVNVEGALDTLPLSVVEVLGRVLHEAAGNVRRHSAQGECALLVSASGDRVELAMINPLRPATQSSHDPLGILGMRERVEVLGGTLQAGGVGTHWMLRSAVPLVGSPAPVVP